MRRIQYFLVLSLLNFSLVGCQTPFLAPGSLLSASQMTGADRGDFKIQVDSSEKVTDFDKILKSMTQEFENKLNQTYRLPKGNVKAIFRDCGRPDAFYLPEKSQIVMCSELYAIMAKQFSESDALEVFRFIFLHELGHALVDQFDLPILGKEEDAVDAMATVFLIEEDQQYRAAILAAINFYAMSQGTLSVNWADNHSLGAQRMFNLVCWASGARPEILKNRTLLSLNVQLAKSGRHCDAEYAQQKKSVETLLKPYKKNITKEDETKS